MVEQRKENISIQSVIGENDNKRFYINNEQCKDLFYYREIFIFGTGIDAEQLEKKLSAYAIILAYVDNKRFGEKRFFCGKKIISLEQCLEQRDKKQPIIIATYKYAKDICKQLTNVSLRIGIDFYIWDDLGLFHYDENSRNYVDFLNRIWKVQEDRTHDNKILIPFENRHEMSQIIYAYCANHYAEKFNAEICSFFRWGTDCENASPIMKEIYKSFNVECLIDTTLNEKQQNEANELCDSIWKNLYTWEDWRKIKVYGICFGTTIIRHLLRVQIPSFDLRDLNMYTFLKEVVQVIVFWHQYVSNNNIKVIFLSDGVTWDGYIRDIAVTKEIPTYALNCKMAKMRLDYYDGMPYRYFKQMWGQLTELEQIYGIQWAKKHIKERLNGGTEDVRCVDKKSFAFAEPKNNMRVLDDNNKIKVMICPHIFEEDCYYCGEQIFDNNYFEWLCHLGELSKSTPNYDWYLKMHPSSSRRDYVIIDMILQRYPHITKIPSNISPLQLRDEGIKYALTVYGSIGHEYPEIGIQVINAGYNPHSTFDFTWNPKTKEEYDNMILNLDKLEEKKDEEGLYQFYSLNYLFYNWSYIPWSEMFFENPLLAMDPIELEVIGKDVGTWRYEEYMKEWTEERHRRIKGQLDDVFQKLDDWRPNILYKRKNYMRCLEEGEHIQ